ncbi:shikimate dehydrogenase family protein [Leadbetterella byssophila]|uniref:shikimate dehydrogenase family protein n=1 Tax=Leadbetterella byssophila TaxID=316068 RepID=UPI0039A2AF78
MRKFGLIGYPLGHSFSKKYFSEKFEKTGISDKNQYDLYEMEHIDQLPVVLKENPELVGLNVTIPHKLNVLPFLSEIDPAAQRIGAVNVLKVKPEGGLKGYNSDYYGFRRSLEEFLNGRTVSHALVLGNGGAAKAIRVALEDLGIEYHLVSRNPGENSISYEEANNLLSSSHLIVNCTPLGTYPKVETAPPLNYDLIGSEHFLYDLVYNPETTRFMQEGLNREAKVLNGYQMLVYQAEKSWEIWNEL